MGGNGGFTFHVARARGATARRARGTDSHRHGCGHRDRPTGRLLGQPPHPDWDYHHGDRLPHQRPSPLDGHRRRRTARRSRASATTPPTPRSSASRWPWAWPGATAPRPASSTTSSAQLDELDRERPARGRLLRRPGGLSAVPPQSRRRWPGTPPGPSTTAPAATPTSWAPAAATPAVRPTAHRRSPTPGLVPRPLPHGPPALVGRAGLDRPRRSLTRSRRTDHRRR